MLICSKWHKALRSSQDPYLAPSSGAGGCCVAAPCCAPSPAVPSAAERMSPGWLPAAAGAGRSRAIAHVKPCSLVLSPTLPICEHKCIWG